MDNIKHRRLQEMDRSDFGVVKGDSDIRGWDVRNSSGRKIGEVEDMVIDAQERKVRYMVVDLKSNELDLKNHKVLIPIGLAELDKNDDDVILSSVTLDQLRHLPTYDLNILDDTTERLICVALGMDAEKENVEKEDTEIKNRNTGATQQREYTTERNSNMADQGNFYRHSYFDDDNLYKNRLHEAKMADVKTDRDDHPKHRQSESDRDQQYTGNQQQDDFDRGLQLRQRQHETGSANNDRDNRDRDLSEERRLEMVRNRRQSYESRRGNQRSGRDDYRDDSRRDRRDDLL